MVREGDLVHWDWGIEVPVNRRMTFDAARYDHEVGRVGADRTWEPPDRTTGRLVLEGVDRKALAAHGLGVRWAQGGELWLDYKRDARRRAAGNVRW